MINEEAKQRAKNYMSLKGALEPKQIKCYCGHTTMCDCGPQDEGKQELELKRVLLNTVIPDAELLAEAFTKSVLQLVKGYEKAEFCFDYKDLPELQDDLETLMKWISVAITEGVITRNEAREVIGMELHSDSNMDIITVKDDVMTLEEAILPKDDVI